MKKIKVVTVVGTRPELIKLSKVIAELDKFSTHILIHTGQNYDFELNEVFFNDLGIRKPNYFLNVVSGNSTLTIADILTKIDPILDAESPDAFLLYGDTNSCLSVIAAKRKKIPIFHMEAGNRCFDQRVPEENNRKIVDHLSDINMPLSEHARAYLLREGLLPERIIKIGSPMREVIKYNLQKINNSDVLKREKLKPGQYFIASIHREENVDSESTLQNIFDSLVALHNEFKIPVILSTHPRTQKRIAEFQIDTGFIRIMKPFGFNDYMNLQMNAFCVLSDSGTITEESAIMGFPAVTLRQQHERPEGMDSGVLIMTGLSSPRIVESVKVVTSQLNEYQNSSTEVKDYSPDNVSLKVVRIILSYTDYINRVVWNKQ